MYQQDIYSLLENEMFYISTFGNPDPHSSMDWTELAGAVSQSKLSSKSQVSQTSSSDDSGSGSGSTISQGQLVNNPDQKESKNVFRKIMDDSDWQKNLLVGKDGIKQW